ncbi:MAG: AraC family transcriptional regulator [Desulfobacteraceae bacterium]|nr:MAG: AraC family transcriptional regulator [Desulfobacteraceae bacterium]
MSRSKTSIIRNAHFPFLELKDGRIHEAAKGNYSTRAHSHEEISIGFLELGSSRIRCRSLDLDMDVNQAILIPPRTVHLCEPHDESRFSFKMLGIDSDWFSTAFDTDPLTLLPQVVVLGQEALACKTSFFNMIPQFEDALQAETESILFLEYLLFNVFGGSSSSGADILPIGDAAAENDIEMMRVKVFVDENFTESIRLETLAGLCRISQYSVLRRFKQAFKLTPHAYILNQRINLAKQMLLSGEAVARVAVDCGFFDQSHFIKTFRQFVGVAPQAYKG